MSFFILLLLLRFLRFLHLSFFFLVISRSKDVIIAADEKYVYGKWQVLPDVKIANTLYDIELMNEILMNIHFVEFVILMFLHYRVNNIKT